MVHLTVRIIAVLAGTLCLSAGHAETTMPLLTPDRAKAAARSELLAHLPILPAAYGQASGHAVAGEPLRVERLDVPDQVYYLVPFRQGPLTSLVVMIDARTGRFLEVSYLQTPAVYPNVSAEKARPLARDATVDKRDRDAIERTAPTLVWRPCEQSQSAFEPIWRFRLPSGDHYVDQTGAAHRELVEPRLKGGGPPGM